MRGTTSRLMTGSLLLCLAAMMAACDSSSDAADGTNGQEAPVPSEEPVHGGEITVGVEAETSGWSPWEDALASSGMMVARSFYEPLMDYNEDGELRPFLAESLEPNEDFSEYVLTVREGITFHDGAPLDAHAVVDNLSIILQPGAGDGGPIEEVVAEDDRTVRITLDRMHVALGDVLAGQAGIMVSPQAAEEARNQPVGTGPFVFDSWQRDQELTVVRNEDYWQEDLPYLDEITFRPIPDEEARVQSLFSGDVDAFQSLLQPTLAKVAEREDEYDLYTHIGNSTGATIYNTAVPPLDDVRVRRAIAHALNPAGAIEMFDGSGISPVAQGLFNPTSRWYDESIEEVWPQHDPDRAQELLDEYVQDPDRSDDQPVGAPVSFTVDTPPETSLVELATLYQDTLRQIGFEVDIRQVEQAAHIQQAIGAPPDFIGAFDAKFWRLGSDGDPDWMTVWFAPESPINFMNYSTEELMDLLLEAQQTADFEERRELYNEVMRIFAEDVPFTASTHTTSGIATVPGLQGFDEWTLPDGEPGIGHPGSQARWQEVWLDPAL